MPNYKDVLTFVVLFIVLLYNNTNILTACSTEQLLRKIIPSVRSGLSEKYIGLCIPCLKHLVTIDYSENLLKFGQIIIHNT